MQKVRRTQRRSNPYGRLDLVLGVVCWGLIVVGLGLLVASSIHVLAKTWDLLVSTSEHLPNVPPAAVSIGALTTGVLLLTVRESRQDRIDRSRPYLTIDFEPDENFLVHWVVRNQGQGHARNIAISFDPVPLNIRDIPLSETGLFREPGWGLPPGTERRSLFDTSVHLFSPKNTAPRQFITRIHYEGSHGAKYDEEVPIDFETFRELMTADQNQTSRAIREMAKDVKLMRSRGLIVHVANAEGPEQVERSAESSRLAQLATLARTMLRLVPYRRNSADDVD